jgi:hypothetical protein
MSDATSLAGGGVILYAVDAENLARIDQGHSPPYTCDKLVCGQGLNLTPPCLRYNLDYWPVASASGAGVLQDTDNVVALSGCLPAALDPAATVARCGADWTDVGGNLHADVLQLVPGGTSAAGFLAVQAAQLSPGLAQLLGSDAGAVVSFGAEDGGSTLPVATVSTEGTLAPSLPQTVHVGTGLASYASLGFAVDVPGLDGGAGHVWMSLDDALQLVDPTQDPTQFFGAPRTYLVAVLGDPNAPHAFTPGAPYDGKGLHLLVLAAPDAPALGDP